MFKTAPVVLFALLATVATATASAAATSESITAIPPATAQEKAQGIVQYAQIRQMAAFGTHCSWLTPIAQLAVDISAEERLAWLTWQKADLAAAQDEAAALVKQAESGDCTTLTDKRKATQFGGWQMRSSWALRGYTMLPIKAHPAWFAGKSTLGEHSKALETVYHDLLKLSATSVTTSIQMFDQTSPTWLSVRCKAKEKGCPAAITDKGQRDYAEAVVKLAERYAAALENVDDKAGIPKE